MYENCMLMTDRMGEGARSGVKRCVEKRELVEYPLKLRECNERDLDLDLKKLNDKISKYNFVCGTIYCTFCPIK